MSDAAVDLVSIAIRAWVSGFVLGYTLKTIKIFIEKI